MHCLISPTDPPVEILLTDGRHVSWTHPMEQELLTHDLPWVSLFHVLFLPTEKHIRGLAYAYTPMHKRLSL